MNCNQVHCFGKTGLTEKTLKQISALSTQCLVRVNNQSMNQVKPRYNATVSDWSKKLNHIKHGIATQMSKEQANTRIKDSSAENTNQNSKRRNHSILKTQLNLHCMLYHKSPWKEKYEKESRTKPKRADDP